MLEIGDGYIRFNISFTKLDIVEHHYIEKWVISVVCSSFSAFEWLLNGEVNIPLMLTCKLSVFPETNVPEKKKSLSDFKSIRDVYTK